jgi:hypothetical protein
MAFCASFEVQLAFSYFGVELGDPLENPTGPSL